MIVFWIQSEWDYIGDAISLSRVYKGRAKYDNGKVTIYQKGKRVELSRFIAFPENEHPPKLISTWLDSSQGMQMIVSRGEFNAYLPPHYIDQHGNIRRTDADLSLVLMGPNWCDSKEREFQDELNMPF